MVPWSGQELKITEAGVQRGRMQMSFRGGKCRATFLQNVHEGVGAVVTTAAISALQQNQALTSGPVAYQVARASAQWRECSTLCSTLFVTLKVL
jgi:hypothetical protein